MLQEEVLGAVARLEELEQGLWMIHDLLVMVSWLVGKLVKSGSEVGKLVKSEEAVARLEELEQGLRMD